MSVRLDPRRRDRLKRLAAEAGVRPGELVTRWIIERLDGTGPAASPAAADRGPDPALDALGQRVAVLERRLAELAASIESTGQPDPIQDAPAQVAAPPPQRGPRQADGGASPPGGPRVALHEEIAAVIAERGPLPAGEIARAVAERNRYHAPRSARPIDAATVNSRVSNPHYRRRFVRHEGRIGLAEG